MRLLVTLAALASPVYVSALALAPTHVSGLARRGPCDTSCEASTSIQSACARAADPDRCGCTESNFSLFNECVNCAISTVQASDAVIGALFGGGAGAGASDEEIRENARNFQLLYVGACASAGYPLSGGSTSSTSSSSSSSSTSSSSTTDSSTFSSSTTSSTSTSTSSSTTSSTTSTSSFTTSSSTSSSSSSTTSSTSSSSSASSSQFPGLGNAGVSWKAAVRGDVALGLGGVGTVVVATVFAVLL